MLSAPSALILNFTGDSYHWGCFGTAYEICQTLTDRGYAVACCSVDASHGLSPSPQTCEDLGDTSFRQAVLRANSFLKPALRQADLVVVNGEGTLHGPGPGARNLLYLCYLAKRFFKKPVHLINHSFYPADDRSACEDSDRFYAMAVRDLDHVVPREPYSRQILQRLGIDAVQGFDCLPRYIRRLKGTFAAPETAAAARLSAPLIVAGGVNMSRQAAQRIARSVAASRRPGQAIRFLTGAKQFPAPEDAVIFGWMRDEVPDIQLVTARGLQEWLDAIENSACLVSGRFHHTIAALTLGTPVLTFPSNTPKIEAIADMLWLDPPLACDDPALEQKIARGLARAGTDGDDGRTERRREKMLALADENFRGIEFAGDDAGASAGALRPGRTAALRLAVPNG